MILCDHFIRVDATVQCLNNEWQCYQSEKCIEVVQICDGIVDCEGGEDEGLDGEACSKS